MSYDRSRAGLLGLSVPLHALQVPALSISATVTQRETFNHIRAWRIGGPMDRAHAAQLRNRRPR